MRAIVGMVLLELADICFPAEIGLVNERDGSISFVTWLVLMMSIKPLVGSGSNLSVGLKINLLDWRGNDLVLRGDDGDLDSVRLGLHGDCFLHIVVGFLLTEEAYDFMVGHTVSLFADCWNCLNESDHGLVALRVEFSVISGLDVAEFVGAILLWCFGNIVLNRIAEVGKESQAIFKLNLEGLIINGGPSSRDVLIRAVNSVFAEDGFSLELVHKLNLPGILFAELELVFVSDNL